MTSLPALFENLLFFVETGGGSVGSVGSVGRWRKSLGIKEDGRKRKRKREKVF
jgi:hypothetical protein